jgi:hypothetical protein
MPRSSDTTPVHTESTEGEKNRLREERRKNRRFARYSRLGWCGVGARVLNSYSVPWVPNSGVLYIYIYIYIYGAKGYGVATQRAK